MTKSENLSLAALEELRMLSNITEGGRASLQAILLGQPQIRRMLATRISTSCASACWPPTTWGR